MNLNCPFTYVSLFSKVSRYIKRMWNLSRTLGNLQWVLKCQLVMGILKRENRTMQIPENLHEKTAMGKNHGAKRKRYSTDEKRLQWVLRTFLQI